MAVPPPLPVTLVQFEAADGWILDAALHQPDNPTGLAAIVLHGKGSDCYTGVPRFVSAALARAGVITLALNMRCHALGYSRHDQESPGMLRQPMAGGAWERLADGPVDIAAAIAWLRRRATRGILLAGHSSGGWYAADYADRDPDIAGFALLSPLLANSTALAGWFPTQEERDRAYLHAKSLVVDGRGDDLIPLRKWYKAISAASLVERFEEPPGRFEAALGASRAPVLLVAGSRESRVPDWQAMFDRLAPGRPRQFVLIEGAEHNYIGYEDQVGAALEAFARSLG